MVNTLLMKRFLILILVFLCNVVIYSQTIKLTWEGSSIIDYGSEKFTVPFFKEKGFSYENSSVFFRFREPFSGTQKVITNLQWEKISTKELYDIQPYNLPETDQTDISYYTNPYTQEKIINFQINTLKNENGATFRLSSFTISDASASATPSSSLSAKNFIAENPLKSGTFYKIKIDKSGVFKITAKFLRDNGINPANINPKNFRIYGNGGVMLPEHNRDFRYSSLQENAIQVLGEDDNVWNEDDYALFYAQGPNGFNLYNTTNASGNLSNRRIETRSDRSANVVNIYEDFSYYFINFDKGPGKRVQADDQPINNNFINRYDAFQFVNEEKFNLMKIGRIWTGDPISGTKTLNFITNSPVQPTDIIKYRTRTIAYQSSGNRITVNINNQTERTRRPFWR